MFTFVIGNVMSGFTALLSSSITFQIMPIMIASRMHMINKICPFRSGLIYLLMKDFLSALHALPLMFQHQRLFSLSSLPMQMISAPNPISSPITHAISPTHQGIILLSLPSLISIPDMLVRFPVFYKIPSMRSTASHSFSGIPVCWEMSPE